MRENAYFDPAKALQAPETQARRGPFVGLASRNNLALAYEDAGRIAGAIPLLERLPAGMIHAGKTATVIYGGTHL